MWDLSIINYKIWEPQIGWRHSIIINTRQRVWHTHTLLWEGNPFNRLTLPEENRSFCRDAESTDSVMTVYTCGHLQARAPSALRGIFQSGHRRSSQGGFVVKIPFKTSIEQLLGDPRVHLLVLWRCKTRQAARPANRPVETGMWNDIMILLRDSLQENSFSVTMS